MSSALVFQYLLVIFRLPYQMALSRTNPGTTMNTVLQEFHLTCYEVPGRIKGSEEMPKIFPPSVGFSFARLMIRSISSHIETKVSAMATKSKFRRWTREETIIVFYLYCQIPFKDSKKSHPEVRRFAKLVDRTPSSVNMKIGNFGSFDPELKRRGITGLRNASRLDKEIWDEFHDNWQALIDESQRLIAEREAGIDSSPDVITADTEAHTQLRGRERLAVRKVRENQPFFRKAILSAYESACCITGIDIETLLIASHIKPWAESDSTEKLNPRNGLCLNALHDRAFDRGLIAVEDNYSVIVSRRVSHSRNDTVRSLLLGYEGQQIQLPTRFIPGPDFIEWHRNNIFVG